MQGIKPMDLSAPWDDSYLNYCKGPPNFDHQTFPNQALFSLDRTPVSDEQTLITIYANISCFLL